MVRLQPGFRPQQRPEEGESQKRSEPKVVLWTLQFHTIKLPFMPLCCLRHPGLRGLLSGCLSIVALQLYPFLLTQVRIPVMLGYERWFGCVSDGRRTPSAPAPAPTRTRALYVRPREATENSLAQLSSTGSIQERESPPRAKFLPGLARVGSAKPQFLRSMARAAMAKLFAVCDRSSLALKRQHKQPQLKSAFAVGGQTMTTCLYMRAGIAISCTQHFAHRNPSSAPVRTF
ncbi:hypothetical protein J6590_020304 [Homalodisca vitripennis]|nr:hypothetical protein J6590_020304 [Homalodisca vitripennis]